MHLFTNNKLAIRTKVSQLVASLAASGHTHFLVNKQENKQKSTVRERDWAYGMQTRTVLPIPGFRGWVCLIRGLNRARLWLAIAGLVRGKIATTRCWHVTISCQPDGRPPQPVRPWKSGRVHLAEGSNVIVLELPYSTEFGWDSRKFANGVRKYGKFSRG